VKPETFNLKLNSMAQGGEALGRDESGRVVFVPYAIAGEEARVEIVEAKKDYARARLVEILTASPARVAPRCPHFGVCGGCQWQHIAYAAQLEFKTEIVREQFARIARVTDAPLQPALGMDDPWRYRNNVQFQLDAAGRLCFRALESHDLVPIRECHLLHPLLDELFHTLSFEGADFDEVMLRAGTRTGEKFLLLTGADDTPPEILVDEPVSIAYRTPRGDILPLVGKDAVHEILRGRTFRISPSAFFQVNSTMAERLVEIVERYLEPRAGDVLLDAFSGVGTFGLALAARVARVIAIEESKDALNDARANAVEFTHIEFKRGQVEDVLPKLETKIDLVVADPPRAGIAPPALEALIARAPRVIAYVSCDPATLARDARRLIEGGYRLVEVQPVDMFPQTYHIESVSRFVREE
jgi:23S rRNA (uracil1939-C5)-methyltransferase